MRISKKSSLNKLLIKSIIFSFLTSIVVIIFIALFWGSQTLTSYLKNESKTHSQLVFTSMQELMKKGASGEDLRGYVDKLNAFYPDRSIQLNTTNFQSIEHVAIEELEDTIKISYPINVEKTCIACHTKNKLGDQKGTIEYTYPIKDVFFSLQDVISLVALFAVTGFLVIFIIVFMYIHRLVAKPLSDLQLVMDKVSNHNDLSIIANPSPIQEFEAIRIAFNRMSQKLSNSFTEVLSASETDELTGLRNRRNFEKKIEHALIECQSTQENMALVMLDLNRFKPINDSYGHQVGDNALKHFARILEKSFRKNDFIFRTGGDEFILILPNISASDVTRVLNNLSTHLSHSPIQISDEKQLTLSCSMGFAIYPLDATTAEALQESADKMMYVEKKKSHAREELNT